MAKFPTGSLVEVDGKLGVINGDFHEDRICVELPESVQGFLPEDVVLLREGGELGPMPQYFPARPSKLPRRRILAFGDSMTAGHDGRSLIGGWHPYADALCKYDHWPDFAVDVWVEGLSGFTAEKMAETLDEPNLTDCWQRTGVGLRRLISTRNVSNQFDLVLIMAGTNDLHFTDAAPQDIAANVRRLHEVCHEAGVRTVALSVPAFGILEDEPERRARWEKVNANISEWASGCEGSGNVAFFVDINETVPFKQFEEPGGYYEVDGLHWSTTGSALLGEWLLDLLGPVLSEDTDINELSLDGFSLSGPSLNGQPFSEQSSNAQAHKGRSLTVAERLALNGLTLVEVALGQNGGVDLRSLLLIIVSFTVLFGLKCRREVRYFAKALHEPILCA